MPSCAIANCRSYYKLGDIPITVYHRFPKDPTLIDIWLTKCKRGNTINTAKARVCSQHFTENDYLRDLKAELLGLKPKRRLKPDAIPSINIPEEEDVQCVKTKKINCRKRVKKTLDDEVSPGTSLLAETTVNFEGMCRLCMKQEKGMVYIFTEGNSLPMKLSHILPEVKIHPGDGLPSQVCRECVQEVEAVHHFLTQCEVSDSTLRKYVNKQIIISENRGLMPTAEVKQQKASSPRITSTFTLKTKNLNNKPEGSSRNSAEVMSDSSIAESQNLKTCSIKKTCETKVDKSTLKFDKRFESQLISQQVKNGSHLEKANNGGTATDQPMMNSPIHQPNNSSVTTPIVFLSDDKEPNNSITQPAILLVNKNSSGLGAQEVSSVITTPPAVTLQDHKSILAMNTGNMEFQEAQANNVATAPSIVLLKQGRNSSTSNQCVKFGELSISTPGLEKQNSSSKSSHTQRVKTCKYSRWKYFIPLELLQQKQMLKLENPKNTCNKSNRAVFTSESAFAAVSDEVDEPVSDNTANNSNRAVFTSESAFVQVSDEVDEPVSDNTANNSNRAVFTSESAFVQVSDEVDEPVSDNTANNSNRAVFTSESAFVQVSDEVDEPVSDNTANNSNRAVFANGAAFVQVSDELDEPVSDNTANNSNRAVFASGSAFVQVSDELDEPVSDNTANKSNRAVFTSESAFAAVSDGLNELLSGYTCSGSDEIEQELMLNKPLMLQYTCKHCGRLFASRRMYQRHQKVHVVHKCNECGKAFATSYKLKIHGRRHSAEKVTAALCDICGLSFTTSSSYMNHKKVHMAPKQYRCLECNKCFTAKHVLQSHREIHATERTFICEKCGIAVRGTAALIKHKRALHGKSYKCTLCAKTYRHRYLLKFHLMVHSGEKPFKCTECDKRFTYKNMLKKHMVVHTGEKKYACKYCDKKFTTSSYRLRHVGLHTGETPYKCADCGRMYTSHRDVRNHRSKVHCKQDQP